MMIQMTTHTNELLKLKDTKGVKLTWKELWENLNSYLTMCSVDSLIDEFENWSKGARQVRLE